MVDIEAEKKAIIKIINDAFEAEDKGDLEGTVAAYSDDVIFQGANMPQLEGIEAVRQFYKDFLPNIISIKGASTKVEVVESGDIAYDYGWSKSTMKGPDGPIKGEGKYYAVWKKIGSDWKCILLAFSGNSMP
jgi:ketosteroid isomerase-like protein